MQRGLLSRLRDGAEGPPQDEVAAIADHLRHSFPAGRAPAYTLGGPDRSRLGQDTWLHGACLQDTHILVPAHRAASRS